jgi:hypothetical protein
VRLREAPPASYLHDSERFENAQKTVVLERGQAAMAEPLTTYLNDHLGGAQIAVQLLQAMAEQHDDANFRRFAQELLPEIQADEGTLRSLVEKIDGASSVKEIGGWILEKLSRIKLGHTGSVNFEMFESLELLAIGIHGKLSLWKALEAAAKADARLRAVDLPELIRRAEREYREVESARIDLVPIALSPAR